MKLLPATEMRSVFAREASKTPSFSPMFRGEIRTFRGKNLGVLLGVLEAFLEVPVQDCASRNGKGTSLYRADSGVIRRLARHALGVFTSKTPKGYPLVRVEFYYTESTYIYICSIVHIFLKLCPDRGVVSGGF